MIDYTLFYIPDSKVHGANMGPIRGRQDPDGPYAGPINFTIWDITLQIIIGDNSMLLEIKII